MKILLTGAYKYSKEQIQIFEKNGYEVVYVEREDQDISNVVLENEIDCIICNWYFMYHDIEKYTKLKQIQLLSAGYDRIPMQYILDKNITINNVRGVYSIPMAEFVISGVLDIYKQKRKFFEYQKRYEWSKIRSLQELSDKNVGIVGCGSVGQEVAKKFSGFTDYIYGVDVVPIEEKGYFKKIYTFDIIKEVLPYMDIVVLTLPLMPQTEHLFDRELISLLKQECIFVNIARGKIVDQAELISALENGNIFGAVLDVFEEEPLPQYHKLWGMPQVIITPHNSFVSNKNDIRIWDIIRKEFNLE